MPRRRTAPRSPAPTRHAEPQIAILSDALVSRPAMINQMRAANSVRGRELTGSQMIQRTSLKYVTPGNGISHVTIAAPIKFTRS